MQIYVRNTVAHIGIVATVSRRSVLFMRAAIEATTRCPSLLPFTVAMRFSLYRTLSPPRSPFPINIRVRSHALIACVSFLFLIFFFFLRNHEASGDHLRWQSLHHRRIIF